MSAIRQRFSGGVSSPELAVFVSGVVSMGLEILAGRMVAPQFGSSIYTWGSIIGVFLAALSLGYYQGGKRASRRATEERLVRVLLATGGFVAVLILAGDMLLAGLSGFPLPPRFASLPAVTILFGPPTYLLGFISPYGAELSKKESTGAASGHVYAVGTIGSIVGAFGATFLLIPTLSVSLIGLVFGLLLVSTSLVILAPTFPRRTVLATLVVGVLLVGAVAVPSAGYSVRGETVYQTQTPYQELVVADLGGTRTLYLDGQPHSAMDLDDRNRHVFEYTRYFHVPFLLTDWTNESTEAPHQSGDIDRVLFIGGGGFTGPKRFVDDYDVTVDVVEIDPEVIRVAESYFGVEERPRLNIYNAEGREFLRTTDRTYDLIVLDAYKKDKVPFQLTTREFMQLTADRLDEDGILLANLISAPTGPASQFYRAEYRTMDQVYPQVYSFPTSGGSVVQNIEVVATKSDERVSQAQLEARDERRDIGIGLSTELADYQAEVETGDVPVLTDDRAPVDALLEPMAGRRYVVSQTGPGGNVTAGTG
ncbi:spermidine synthase [Halorientalis pallida]|uniref:Spermidine synthase n=1 Tax=Halorientalis pallida TaxID=2479928 RepID=A0A498L6M1_9EURY|nr:fused MFS/spermidine synthase [Halorientalis pallida]RXK50355.1 spermidine synthase [Halorientalis pallida]